MKIPSRDHAETVMNTIPTTSSNILPSYTAVGGTERSASTGLSAVILNRGGRYSRYEMFDELMKAGFDYILSMESGANRYDLENLTQTFPSVRFILFKDTVSIGDEINLAAAELTSPLFFVMRSDMKILRGGQAERMAERLLAPQGQLNDTASPYKRLCTVPVIQDTHAEILPTLIVPALIPENKHGLIKTIPVTSLREGHPTLFPFDGIGIYDRERFIRLGGYDSSIKSSYWQLMDFGFRSSLWGEEIASTQFIKMSYETELPLENSTVNESSLKFILKNLSPVFRKDYAHIPYRRFFDYYKRRRHLSAAWKEFKEARDWVKINRYRFKSDARTIAERFITEEEDISQEKQ